ncbi:MAG: hypothetical protein JW737_02985 [Acidobacteria bacterium]|nr:hypothetical protein [Acidobacteriota bacterium]
MNPVEIFQFASMTAIFIFGVGAGYLARRSHSEGGHPAIKKIVMVGESSKEYSRVSSFEIFT